MFTIEQIKATHSKVKSGADFPAYVQELKALGLTHYDLYVKNGQGVYYGENNFRLEGKSGYDEKMVSDTADTAKLKHALAIHQQGQTTYLTFTDQAADAGVEKWTTSMKKMQVIYYDKDGNEMLSEQIPD